MEMEAKGMQTLPEHPERATIEGKHKVLGVWFFLGGETVLFASLFGSYLALRNEFHTGPEATELFHLELVFVMTVILLTSSLTSVLGIWAMQKNDVRKMLFWFSVTVLLGLAFLGFEIYEFAEYMSAGLGYSISPFASAFYTLVGFHGAHVLFGVVWIIALIIQGFRWGLNLTTAPKFYVASLYWHFIDVVWVFIFTAVYLLGKAG